MIRGEKVELRPIEPADAEPLRRIHAEPEVARWWGEPEDDFPASDDPEVTRLIVLAGGEIAGLVQFREENHPDYRNAEVDLFISDRLQNRGLGTEALTAVVRHLIDDRGHHRLVISADVENARAIRCYEKAGFRPVGVLHACARLNGEWRDELLMELVVPPPGTARSPASR
jgi:aminoglycoside 6'-N-acetyltransferase